MKQASDRSEDTVRVFPVNGPQLCDDLDIIAESKRLDALLEGQSVTRLVLDFGEVEVIGSGAIGMLTRLRNRCSQRGCTLILCSMRPSLRGVFRATNLHQVFEIPDTLKEAMEAGDEAIEPPS